MLELLPEEIELAQKIAYQKCLDRGGGKEPPYDPEAVVGEFWQAAEQVIAGRTPVEATIAAFYDRIIIPLFADITRTLEVTCHTEGADNHGSNFVGNGAVLSAIEAVAQFTDETTHAERQGFAEEAKNHHKGLNAETKKYLVPRHTPVDGSQLAMRFMKDYFGPPIATEKAFGVHITELIWAFRNAHLHAFYPFYRKTFGAKAICGGVGWLYLDPANRVGIRIQQLEADFDTHKEKLYKVEEDWFLICPQIVFVYFKRAVKALGSAIRNDEDTRRRFLDNWTRLAPSYGISSGESE
jgi:hypothetical protein